MGAHLSRDLHTGVTAMNNDRDKIASTVDRLMSEFSAYHGESDKNNNNSKLSYSADMFAELLRVVGRMEGRLHHVADVIDRVERSMGRAIIHLEQRMNVLEEQIEKHDRSFFRITTAATIIASTFSAIFGLLATTKLAKLLAGIFNG